MIEEYTSYCINEGEKMFKKSNYSFEIYKELRKLNNLSMDKLGKEINMSSGEISDIENGKKKDPRISTLIRIADYFNISLDELIGRKLED